MRFEACAESYDRHAGPQRTFAARVAEFIEASEWNTASPKPRELLELGAGTGALTENLVREPGRRVLATDAAKTMVRMGRGKVPSAAWHELDAFQGALPRADLQVSSGLLQWAPDPLAVLAKWRDNLNPGARMVHAFPCEPCMWEWRMLVPQSPITWRDEAGWIRIFTQVGLRVVRHRLWVEPVVYGSALELLRAWHSSGVTGSARVRAGRLRQAIRDYDAAWRTAGGVTSTWAWLAIEALPSG